jgi:hypothetical protein
MSSLRLLSAMAPYGGLFPRSHAATPSDAIVPAGLVGWWTMDVEDTNFAGATEADRSGNGNVGTLNNLPASSGVTGQIGQALSFNGTSTYISVPQSSILQPLAAITLSAWVFPKSTTNNQWVISRPYTTGAWASPFVSYGLEIFDGTNTPPAFQVTTITHGRNNLHSSLGVLTTNVWAHIAGVYTGAKQLIYVNGQLAGSVAQSTNIDYTGGASNVDIGQRSEYSAGEFLNCNADDVRIYNRALDQGEILQLYSAGLAGLAYWPSSGQMAALDPSTWGYDPDMPAVIRQQTLLSA